MTANPDRLRIGIDLGGTKIAAIALGRGGTGGDTAGDIVLAERRVATPRGDYAGTLGAIAGLVGSVEAALGRVATVGIGMPGAIAPETGFVRNANSTWLNGRPFAADAEAALGRPVRVENDANCLAVSEAADGAGAGLDVVWAVILGTGVGSGIAVGGRPLPGRHRIAGEWGHTPLPAPRDDERPGPACYCGRRGCLETWLSGPGLAADHARRTGAARVRAEEIVAGMRAGDPEAAASFEAWIDRLGRGVAGIVNVLDPDAIVLGGGLSEVEEVTARLPAAMAPHVFCDRVSVPVRRSRHGAASGVRSAARLWP